MIHKFLLPSFGPFVKWATIINWLKNNGEPITKNEPIAIVQAHKAMIELTAPATGILYITIPKYNKAMTGAQIALICDNNEEVPTTTSENIPIVNSEFPVFFFN